MAAGFSNRDGYREFLAICQKQRVGTVIPSQYAILYNQSQEEVIGEYLEAIELNKEIYDALLPLKRIADNVTFALTNGTYAYRIGTYTIPNSVRRVLKVSIKLAATGVPVKCALLKSNESTDILNGVFSRPSEHQCYYSKNQANERIINVYVPSSVVASSITGYIEYYVEPTLVNQSDVVSDTLESVFNKEVCAKIINVAARKYIERVQDARYPTYVNEMKQS